MNLGTATSNQDALDKMRKRFDDDVVALFQLCSNSAFFPLWVLSRAMFPCAESIAALLFGNSTRDTAANLTRFIRDELGRIDPRYVPLASTLCQVWRHGLTHHDEPPFLIVRPLSESPLEFDLDTRAVSWKLAFNDALHHMTTLQIGPQNLQFTFSLATFCDHLQQVLYDQTIWLRFTGTEVMDRYNEWAVKVLDHSRLNSESGRAAQEILALLP